MQKAIKKLQIRNSIPSSKHIKRRNEYLQNQQQLRVRALQRSHEGRNLFSLNQKQLCDYFVNYDPLPYSSLNLRKVMDANMDHLRLVKMSSRIFFGEVKGQVWDGRGVVVEKNGKVYQGTFQFGEKHGNGFEVSSNGNVYVGQYMNGKKHGKGQFYWFNLSPPTKPTAKFVEFYDGTWWAGLPDGRGSHQKANGDIYDGTFKNGLKHGQGEQYFSNGDCYKGDYGNNVPEGIGVYVWADGSKYEGDFKQGLRSGYGQWSKGEGMQFYSGRYAMDKKWGYGQYSWGNGFLYKGHFENDIRHGYGELFQNGKLIYRGEWNHGKMVDKEKIKKKTIKLDKVKITKLKPPSSAIFKRLNPRQFSPQSQKSLPNSRSRSTPSTKKPSKKQKTQVRGQFSFKRTAKKKPLFLSRTIDIKKKQNTAQGVLVHNCSKKNCGANYFLPEGLLPSLNQTISKKQRSISKSKQK